jgi:hypothetical protein
MTSLLANATGQVVANLGHNGYGPQQELVVLKRFGLAMHPQTVLWVFSEATDIGDAAQYVALTRRVSNFWLSFFDRSFTKNALKSLRPVRKEPTANGLGVFQSARGTSHVYFTANDEFSFEPLPKTTFPGLDETVRTLESAADLCAGHGCRVIFIYAPDKFRVLHEFCAFPEGSPWRRSAVNDLPERLRGMLESSAPGIGYLDLTPALRADAASGAMPYAIDDGHWSEEGERVAALAVEDYLSTQAGGPGAGRPASQ